MTDPLINRPSRETVMNALYNHLVNSAVQVFTANMNRGDPVLYQPSSMVGLFVGMPVAANGVPENAFIVSLVPLTLSEAPTTSLNGVSCSVGFQTFGRRLIHWGKVSEQPALFLREHDEELEYQNIILQVQTIKAEMWIYSNAGRDPDIPPITGLNNLLDITQRSMAPVDPTTMRFTLNGLVHWCRMQGKVEKEPGDLDGQAIAVADILITVP